VESGMPVFLGLLASITAFETLSSSNVCKMAAVALDWDLAFGYGFRDASLGEVNQEHARWIEVDEKGAISPPWRPFQLF
jgi:hypothetical protein